MDEITGRTQQLVSRYTWDDGSVTEGRQDVEPDAELWRVPTPAVAVASVQQRRAELDHFLDAICDRIPRETYLRLEEAINAHENDLRTEALARLVSAGMALNEERRAIILEVPAAGDDAMIIPSLVPAPRPARNDHGRGRRFVTGIAAAFLAGLGVCAAARRLVGALGDAAAMLVR